MINNNEISYLPLGNDLIFLWCIFNFLVQKLLTFFFTLYIYYYFINCLHLFLAFLLFSSFNVNFVFVAEIPWACPEFSVLITLIPHWWRTTERGT